MLTTYGYTFIGINPLDIRRTVTSSSGRLGKTEDTRHQCLTTCPQGRAFSRLLNYMYEGNPQKWLDTGCGREGCKAQWKSPSRKTGPPNKVRTTCTSCTWVKWMIWKSFNRLNTEMGCYKANIWWQQTRRQWTVPRPSIWWVEDGHERRMYIISFMKLLIANSCVHLCIKK